MMAFGLIGAFFRALLRPRSELMLENLALRQQLAALRRSTPRPRLRRRDRLFWVLLSRSWGTWRWGGHGGDHYLNTGGRYNPATDGWQATSTVNAPAGRDDHTAVWTGNEMVAWGGYDGDDNLNTGGRYNPATDSWQATSTLNAPTRREDHTAVWTGSEMVVGGLRRPPQHGRALQPGDRHLDANVDGRLCLPQIPSAPKPLAIFDQLPRLRKPWI